MYRLLIVEDEPMVRDGLEKYMPWAEMGFEVAASFGTGEEALAWMQHHPCDVVMTDIVMGQISGLDLLSHARQIDPHIKVVILSGHSNFNYAQQAVRLGVFDYLLKPVNKDELFQTFGKLKKLFDQDSHLQRHTSSLGSATSQIMEQSFFKNLLSGHIYSADELRKCLRMIGLEEEIIQYPFLSFTLTLSTRVGADEMEDIAEDSVHEEIETKLRNALMSQRRKYACYVFKGKSASWNVLIFSLIERELRYLRDSVHRKLQNFVDSSDILTPFQVAFETTNTLQHLIDLVNSFLTAPKMVQDAYQGTELENELYQRYLSQYRRIVIELDIGQEERIRSLVHNISIGLSQCSLEQSRFILKNMFAAIAQDYQTRSLNVSEITCGQFDQAVLYQAEQLEDMMATVEQAFLALSTEIRSFEDEHNDRLIRAVVEYIKKNLHREINNNILADHFQVHYNYMSRSFKKKTGEKLNDFVARQRFEKAVLLLETNKYTVSQVSEMVGYSSASYFVTSFKGFAGCSPTEYWHQGWSP